MLFEATTFGLLLYHIWGKAFYRRSWSIFLTLAHGWVMSAESHTIAAYIWASGGSKNRHFSRYYAFFYATFWSLRVELWSRFYRWLDGWLPQDAALLILVDDTTRKKSGRKIEGVSNYHNHAGTARQEYRVLRGLNYVSLSLRLQWRGHHLTLPVGCDVYLKEENARLVERSWQSRASMARKRIQRICEAMPHRQFTVCADGGYANKEMLRDLPDQVKVVTRLLVSASIYEPPCPVTMIGKRGRKPQKGAALPAPKDWPQHYHDWQPHPTEAGAWIRTAVIRWPRSYPGKDLRVVGIWRPELEQSRHPRDQKRAVEAFISTDVHLSPSLILYIYQARWAIEIDIRDAVAFYGLGQDRCRNLQTIEAVNEFRLMLAAARTSWFMIVYVKAPLDLNYLRPWYTKKVSPSQADIAIALREVLQQEKIKPIPRFYLPLGEIRKQWRSFAKRAA